MNRKSHQPISMKLAKPQYDYLSKRSRRTGETMTALVERAIENLKHHASNRKNVLTQRGVYMVKKH